MTYDSFVSFAEKNYGLFCVLNAGQFAGKNYNIPQLKFEDGMSSYFDSSRNIIVIGLRMIY